MKLYLIWVSGKVLLGEVENNILPKEKTLLHSCIEVKSFFVPTPEGVKEIYNLTPLIPADSSLIDIEIVPDVVFEIKDSNDISKMYYRHKASSLGLSMLSNLNEVNTFLNKKLI